MQRFKVYDPTQNSTEPEGLLLGEFLGELDTLESELNSRNFFKGDIANYKESGNCYSRTYYHKSDKNYRKPVIYVYFTEESCNSANNARVFLSEQEFALYNLNDSKFKWDFIESGDNVEVYKFDDFALIKHHQSNINEIRYTRLNNEIYEKLEKRFKKD